MNGGCIRRKPWLCIELRTASKEIKSDDDYELAVILYANLSVLVDKAFAVIFDKTSERITEQV